jgi:peptide/nickel transport system permease protein
VIVVVGLVFTPIVARTVRAAVSVESEREYVEAARLRGEGPVHIALREILPNITGPLLVEATARLGGAVFASASLSFLGLGVQPPTPDWGLAIATDYVYLPTAWWAAVFPALALSTLVIGVGLVAEALSEESAR